MMMVSKGDCWRKKEEWNCPVIIGEWSLSRPHSWLYLQFRFIPALPGDDGKCDPDWLWQHKTIQPYNCRLPASVLPGHWQDKSGTTSFLKRSVWSQEVNQWSIFVSICLPMLPVCYVWCLSPTINKSIPSVMLLFTVDFVDDVVDGRSDWEGK